MVLEYLKFQMWVCLGKTLVDASVKNGNVFYRVCSYPRYEADALSVRVPKKIGEAWLSRLERLNIGSWRSRYESEHDLCDGAQWSLEYKKEGRRCRHISGDNAYPPNWDEFMEALDSLAPEARLIKPSRLDRLELSYCCVTVAEGAEEPKCTLRWEYEERLVVDRKSETLTYKINIGTECIVTHEYHVNLGIPKLLDDCGEIAASFDVTGEKLCDKEAASLKLTLTRHRDDDAVFVYGGENRALPEGWGEFVNEIIEFISFYDGFAGLLDTNVLKRGEEYIYCSVEFPPVSKSYYYRTEDDSLKVGDMVIVPVGNDGDEEVAFIRAIEHFPEDRLPFPLAKTKRIICKADGG